MKTNYEESIMELLEDNSEESREIILNRFKNVIDFYLTKYKNVFKNSGVDREEAYAEALYGFNDALNNYNEQKDCGFETFLSICIERRLIKVIRKYNTHKGKFNHSLYSLDYVMDEDGVSLLDTIMDESTDPLNVLSKEENKRDLEREIDKVLSDFEKEVYNYMIEGFTYKEISDFLDKDAKQIDNAMQRIKIKIKDIIISMN